MRAEKIFTRQGRQERKRPSFCSAVSGGLQKLGRIVEAEELADALYTGGTEEGTRAVFITVERSGKIELCQSQRIEEGPMCEGVPYE